jgi:ankyrin repeat protein
LLINPTLCIVGCDGCYGWFHFSCLGIKSKELKKEKWHCPKCSKNKSPVKSPRKSPASLNERKSKVLKYEIGEASFDEREMNKERLQQFIVRDDIFSLSSFLNHVKNFEYYSNFSLNFACRSGKVNCVSWLIQRGVAVNSKFEGTSLLEEALAYEGDSSEELIQLLLSAQADPNVADKLKKSSPLILACQLNGLALVKLLVQHNASFSALPDSEDDPLSLLVEASCSAEILQYLLENSVATVTAASLESACEVEALDTFSLFITETATDTLLESNVLTLALDQENVQFTELILKKAKHSGILLNLLTRISSRTSLCNAARRGNIQLIQLFIAFFEVQLIQIADALLCAALAELVRSSKSHGIEQRMYLEPCAVISLGLLCTGAGSSFRVIPLALRHCAAKLQEMVSIVNETRRGLETQRVPCLRSCLPMLPYALIDLVLLYGESQLMEVAEMILLQQVNKSHVLARHS